MKKTVDMNLSIVPHYEIYTGSIHIHICVSTSDVIIKWENIYVYTTKWQTFMIIIAVIVKSHWMFLWTLEQNTLKQPY